MSSTTNTLYVTGASADSISGVGGWTADGQENIAGVNYNKYTATSGVDTAILYVETVITDQVLT